MKIRYSILFVIIIFFSNCKKNDYTKLSEANSHEKLTSFVNPFIGTGGHGHTFPGATLPFGMIQLSPDTRLDGWDGCSGYHYSDNEIFGFSHTHLSGTGVSDYGDILLMPTNKIIFNNGADGKEGYKSKFSHEKEIAEPGYYKVYLEDTKIEVELATSYRSGIHKYTFPENQKQIIILDLEHRDELLDYKLDLVSNTQISGYRFSKAWATDQRLFYSINFSKPFTKVTFLDDDETGKNVKAAFEFDASQGRIIETVVGISPVDEEGALNNWNLELANKNLTDVKKDAQKIWEKHLNKIVIESENVDYKTSFYTSLYHTMIAPNLYQDIDGRYRGMDNKIHKTNDFKYYTVFSLWDTYRATHPLYTIIEQDRTNDFINTFLAKYDEGGILPIWDLSASYTGCMIGYHAVPVIADAYLKGLREYDIEKALEAIKHSATRDKLGLDSYKSFGYIPVEKESESVSKTLEYAYDDWTIAQMAKLLNKENDYKTYIERAQYYKNIYDPSSKFMRGRFRNTWFTPFDPYEVNFNYTEANSWQYSFYVPQDVSGFIKLLGGKEQLESQLDKLFSAKNKTSGSHQVDITGLIGQYAHGNEPSHHMAYLYNFINKPHKTQEKVHQILTELYENKPDGISGNEDCGQMSAWYIFSSLGFYPVTPGSNEYIIGTPLFDKATINLENGMKFNIQVENLSSENKYIKQVWLNGETHNTSFITHQDIIEGGNLVFEMTNSPSTWATSNDEIPKTEIADYLIIPAPFIEKGDIAFKEKTLVVLNSADKNSEIYYRLGNEGGFKKYKEALMISSNTNLDVYAQQGDLKSSVITTDFYKIDPNLKINLQSKYANQYNAGGQNALIDGITGTKDFRTGTWQGYWNEDVVAVVDLGKPKSVSSIKTNFLRDQRSWIFLPTQVEIYTSYDGKNFQRIKNWKAPKYSNTDEVEINTVSLNKKLETRYVKVIAKKLGQLPKWHLGHAHDGRSWIFIDEIQVN